MLHLAIDEMLRNFMKTIKFYGLTHVRKEVKILIFLAAFYTSLRSLSVGIIMLKCYYVVVLLNVCLIFSLVVPNRNHIFSILVLKATGMPHILISISRFIGMSFQTPVVVMFIKNLHVLQTHFHE